jgi:hypothetical protein
MLVACSNNDEKKWEPEIAVSLGVFDVDVSQYLNMDDLTVKFFTRLPIDLQKSSMARFSTLLLDSMDNSVGEDVRGDLLAFMNFVDDRDKKPAEMVGLLTRLMDSFRKHDQFFAINYFTYAIMDEVRTQDTSFRRTINTLFTDPSVSCINFRDTISVDMQQITDFDKIEQIRWMKVQALVSSRLQIRAEIQSNMCDNAGNVLDSMLYAGGENGIKMPFPKETGMSKPILHSYEHQDLEKLITSIGYFTAHIYSDSLGLTLDKVRNLHNQKVSVSIGIMLKTTINDTVE